MPELRPAGAALLAALRSCCGPGSHAALQASLDTCPLAHFLSFKAFFLDFGWVDCVQESGAAAPGSGGGCVEQEADGSWAQAKVSREWNSGSRASRCLTRLPEPEPDRCGEARNVPVDPFSNKASGKVPGVPVPLQGAAVGGGASKGRE